MGQKIENRIKEDILPVLKKLKLRGTSAKYVSILEARLMDLVYSNNPSAKINFLTPQEREICTLIKEGLTTKEIASILSLSSKTIDRHRDNIRKKAGLANDKISLSDWLLQTTP